VNTEELTYNEKIAYIQQEIEKTVADPYYHSDLIQKQIEVQNTIKQRILGEQGHT
jgi:hypothetical protein